jgi:uncharacterized membrane protein
MKLLILGILIWSCVHLLPAAAPGLRKSLVDSLGENGYKAVFALCMVGAVLLMISGWKGTADTPLYTVPERGGIVTLVTMLGTSLSFFAPYMDNNLRRLLRHPQLTGIILFGIGHLAAVGNPRSIVLFGGLALWAALEILLINRREGAWTKPVAATVKDDVKLFLSGLGFFMIFMFTHEALFGVSPLPA